MLTIHDFRDSGMPVLGVANTPDEAAALAVRLGIEGHAYFEAHRQPSMEAVFERVAKVRQLEMELDETGAKLSHAYCDIEELGRDLSNAERLNVELSTKLDDVRKASAA